MGNGNTIKMVNTQIGRITTFDLKETSINTDDDLLTKLEDEGYKQICLLP